MATLMSRNERVGEGWAVVANNSYRSATNEWSKRVKRSSQRIEAYLEAVAEAMLGHCTYLHFADEKGRAKKAVAAVAKPPRQ